MENDRFGTSMTQLRESYMKEVDCINALFRHSIESLTAFFNTPQDEDTRKEFIDTIDKLWFQWHDFYYIHASNFLSLSESDSIVTIPSYIREDIKNLKTAMDNFDVGDNDGAENTIAKLSKEEQKRVMERIERDFDEMNRDIIEKMADLLSRISVFRDTVYPQTPPIKDKDGEIIPFRKEDK